MTNLRTKKALAAKALKVGKNRVVFNSEGISEIEEAITKQDIKDLVREGIISIKLVKGRKKVKKRKTKRGPGKIKKKVKHRKQEYVKITRKLRKYVMELRNKGEIERELYRDLRKKIKMRNFKSKANLREYLGSLKELGIVEEKKIKKKAVKKIKVDKDEKKGEGKETDKLNFKKIKKERKNETG